MKKIETIKRKISYALLSFLFGFSLGVILLAQVVNLKNAEIGSKNVAGIQTEERTISSNQIEENCVISDDQVIDQVSEDDNEDDVLFIGCNGFF